MFVNKCRPKLILHPIIEKRTTFRPTSQITSNFIDFLNRKYIAFRDVYYVKRKVVFVPDIKSYVGVEEKLHAIFILALDGSDGHFQFWPLYSRGNIAR
jgi:hypothetical protein